MAEHDKELVYAKDLVETARNYVGLAVDKLCITVQKWHASPLLLSESQKFLNHAATLVQIYKDLDAWVDTVKRYDGDASTKA